jgi:hypothetical protein
MLGLSAIAGLLSAAPAIYQAISGTKQVAQGKLGLNNLGPRPEYQIPNEINQMTAMARANVADPYMAGENRMLDQANQSAANAFAQSKEAGNPLAMLGSINANTNQSLNQIGIQSAQQQNMDVQALTQQLQNLANYKDQQWQMNTFAPYQDKYSEYRDMIGAGNKNIFDALQTGSTAAINNFIKPTMAQQSLLGSQTTIPTGSDQNPALTNLINNWRSNGTLPSNQQQPSVTSPTTTSGTGLPNDYLGNLIGNMLKR